MHLQSDENCSIFKGWLQRGATILGCWACIQTTLTWRELARPVRLQSSAALACIALVPKNHSDQATLARCGIRRCDLVEHVRVFLDLHHDGQGHQHASRKMAKQGLHRV